jgi:hypothetical protein
LAASFFGPFVFVAVLAGWMFRRPFWPFWLVGRFGVRFCRFGCLSVSAVWPFWLFGRFGVRFGRLAGWPFRRPFVPFWRFGRFGWLAVSASVLIVWLF